MTSVTGFRAFSAENRPKNMPIIGWLKAYAEKKGATRSQVALAWLLAKGLHVVPIPGSRNEAHLLENLGAVSSVQRRIHAGDRHVVVAVHCAWGTHRQGSYGID